jgi:hypothetical protein
VDVIRIDSPLNLAIQPFSVAKTSDHKYLGRRLFQKMAESPETFEQAGFHFRLPVKPQRQFPPPEKRDAPAGEGTGAAKS